MSNVLPSDTLQLLSKLGTVNLESLLKVLFNSSDQVLILLTHDLKIIYLSRGASEYLQVRPSEAHNRYLLEYLPDEIANSFHENTAQLPVSGYIDYQSYSEGNCMEHTLYIIDGGEKECKTLLYLIRPESKYSSATGQSPVFSANSFKQLIVTEVHHRIKNHLQGLLGLISRQNTLYPETEHYLIDLAKQLNVLAEAHGLHATSKSPGVLLSSLVQAILKLHAHENIESFSEENSAILDEGEVVPIALIINEIIRFSIAKRRKTNGDQGIKLECVPSTEESVCLIVKYPYADQEDNNPSSPLELDLARRLLPPNCSSLSVGKSSIDGEVVQLRLSYPAILV